MCLHKFVGYQAANLVITEHLDLVNFCRGAEAIEEMQERYA